MKISKEEVLHVAELARLTIAPEETDRLADQLGQILGYVDTLKGADTGDVAPMSHAVHLVNALREDVVGDHLGADVATANAPASEEGRFVVPKVVG